MTADRDRLPVMTIDFDGVICRPPLGVNLGIRSDFVDPDAAPAAARVFPRWLGDPLDHLRFDFRGALPEAGRALATIAEQRRVVILTGRRSSPERWLERHGLDGYVDDIVINRGALKSPHHKQEWVRRLDAREHIDDDGRTAQLLAAEAGLTVYLRDWPRNRGPRYSPAVRRVADLAEVAALIAESLLDER